MHGLTWGCNRSLYTCCSGMYREEREWCDVRVWVMWPCASSSSEYFWVKRSREDDTGVDRRRAGNKKSGSEEKHATTVLYSLTSSCQECGWKIATSLQMSPLKEQSALLIANEKNCTCLNCEYWPVLTSSGHKLEPRRMFCENTTREPHLFTDLELPCVAFCSLCLLTIWLSLLYIEPCVDVKLN